MKQENKYVLIACECSQVECAAFREIGCIAFSCDIKRQTGGHPEWHIQEDVTPFLKGRRYFNTNDGKLHHVPKWHLIIAHPPCTYLCNLSGVQLMKNGQRNEIRYAHGIVAREFFYKCINAACDCVAVENPTPLSLWQLPTPTQVIQPYQYGHPYSKRTCLWLRNLPPLLPELWTDGHTQYVRRSRLSSTRARAFSGIAKAMANQWHDVI